MKKIIVWKLFIFFLLALQLSCKKTADKPANPIPEPPVTLAKMTECHLAAATSWDSSAIHTNLLGTWEWEYIRCYWKPEDANNKDFVGLTVEFKTNNTVEVKLNGQTTQTASWEVVKLNDGYYKINVTPIVLQLPGRILFCAERVLFYDSYVDGCDNYFKKKS